MHKTALILSLFFIQTFATANVNFGLSTLSDSTYTHITKRAAILSACIPGAGQFYNEIGYRNIPNKKNRSWWKIPVIYGGLGVCGYYFYQNNKFANLTKQEYLFQVENEGFLDERFVNYPSENTLIVGYESDNITYKGFDNYAQRRDLFIVGFIAVWGLNVLEAYVDAHFVTFDVSEDLSLNWYPTLLANKYPGFGIQLNLN